jgi:hypothetical protein
VRGINCRGSRLVLFAGLVIALAAPALIVVAAHAQGASTTTTLAAGTLSGCVQPLTVTVTAGGSPLTSGTVNINDQFNGNAVLLATVALSSSGTASPSVALAAGSHSLTANFKAITGYNASTSSPAIAVSVTTQCEFTVGVSNFTPSSTPANTLTLTAGQAGSFTITVVPSVEFTSTLTAPMFVTLACSGLPDGATCSATPENLEILSTTPETCPSASPASACPPTSTMVIQTYAASTVKATPPTSPGNRSNPIAWAFLLPGALGLGGLAFGARRRRWLSRLSLLALVGLVTLLGTTACNPRYNYLNHGPPTNPATPAGNYNIKVTAQSSNGVTGLTQTASFVLTVQ